MKRVEPLVPPLPGVAFTANGKLWAVCADCDTLVRLDKPLIGSLHLCEPRRSREGG
jgi:hypothetical protein